MPMKRLPRKVEILTVAVSIGLAISLVLGGKVNGDTADKTTASSKQPQAAAAQGTESGARALLGEFLKANADHVALSGSLQPATEDYLSVFEPEFARKAQATYAPAWSGGQLVIAPKPGQTQLLLFSASTEDLKTWKGNAALHFPGGYQKVAAKYKDGLTLYAFKFVEPGQTLGMAYDGLVFVNGHWRIFPKPWRIGE